MPASIEKKIQAIIESGETIKIIYQGGSQPGSPREIAPHSIKGSIVIADCITTGKTKTFKLEKIELVEGTTEKVDYSIERSNLKPARENKYKSIDMFLEEKRTFLENLGWTIKVENSSTKLEAKKEVGYETMIDHFESLCLHSKFKNGKLRKTSDVSLCFYELTWDMDWGDIEIDESNHKKGRFISLKNRVRPWRVDGKDKGEGKTYTHLGEATKIFLEYAKELKP
tara:strand:+ start:198 stop:875 length:678 start_codon:yes stop_codon:yes gene_type:complete